MQTNSKRYIFVALPILGIGFLRLLLALSVVFTHSQNIPFFGFISGTMAVQSFFVVSGFYMALILTEKYKKYSSFILNRFLRIFPLYYAVLAITVVVLLAFGLLHHHVNIFKDWYDTNPVAMFLLIVSNISIFGQDLLYFVSLNPHTGTLIFLKNFYAPQGPFLGYALFVRQAWTLSLELMFYLVAPFLVNRKNGILFLLIAFFGLVRFLLIYKLSPFVNDQLNFFFLAELVFFLLGILSYRIYKKIEHTKIDGRALALFALALFLFISFYTRLPGDANAKEGLFFFMLIFGVPLLFRLSQSQKFDRYIGDLSYPMYLCHLFIIESIAKVVPISGSWVGLVAAVLSIVASIGLYHAVVKPIDSFRKQKLQTASDIKGALSSNQ